MLDSVDGSGPGPYVIHVVGDIPLPPPPVPPNDNCDNATDGGVLRSGRPLQFTGDNTGATPDGDPPFGDSPEVWVRFTTEECMDVTVDYCGTNPAFGGVFIAMTTACFDGPLIWNRNYDDTTCGDHNYTVRWADLPAGIYYYAVLSDSLHQSEGPYVITMSGTACWPRCTYAVGDINNSGALSGLDVVYGVSYLKGDPAPPYACECPPGSGHFWYVAGDVNGDCGFSGLDITYMVQYVKGGPVCIPCPTCAP